MDTSTHVSWSPATLLDIVSTESAVLSFSVCSPMDFQNPCCSAGFQTVLSGCLSCRLLPGGQQAFPGTSERPPQGPCCPSQSQTCPRMFVLEGSGSRKDQRCFRCAGGRRPSPHWEVAVLGTVTLGPQEKHKAQGHGFPPEGVPC